jgi:hypothetical protein
VSTSAFVITPMALSFGTTLSHFSRATPVTHSGGVMSSLGGFGSLLLSGLLPGLPLAIFRIVGSLRGPRLPM